MGRVGGMVFSENEQGYPMSSESDMGHHICLLRSLLTGYLRAFLGAGNNNQYVLL